MHEVPQPTLNAGFLRDLKGFDENLIPVWGPLEDVEKGVFAHWIILRRLPEREWEYVQKNGIMQREETTEPVVEWTDRKGRYTPLDGRLFAHLAKRDPLRWSSSRFEGFKKMQASRRAKKEKGDADEREELFETAADELVVEMTDREKFGSIVMPGLREEKEHAEEETVAAGGAG